MKSVRVAACWAVVMIGVANPVFAGDWPGFLGAGRDSVSHETGLMRDWPGGGPRVLWTVEVGRGYGGAAIDGGQVFILDRDEEKGDRLRVLDVTNGKELWHFEYDAPGRFDHAGSRSTPTVDGDCIYTLGGYGQFHCIDRTTHRAIWNVDIQKRWPSGRTGWGLAQSPLVVGDVVIVSPVSRSSPGLVAMDKKTGKVVWESEKFGGDYYASPILRTVAGVRCVIQIVNEAVVAVDPANGKTLWKFTGYRCQYPIPAPVVMSDGEHVFLTGGYGAGSMTIDVKRSGPGFAVTQVAKMKNGCQIHTPVELHGKLYANINENGTLRGPRSMANGGLACIDPLAGKLLWHTGANPNFDRGAVLLAGDRLLAMDGKLGVLHLVEASPARYKQVAETKPFERAAGNEVWAPMALANGLLVIRDQTHMKCLDLRAAR